MRRFEKKVIVIAGGGTGIGAGTALRVANGKSRVVIAENLFFFPTGMTLGPDGNLYVFNVGFGPPPVGLGQVLKIELLD